MFRILLVIMTMSVIFGIVSITNTQSTVYAGNDTKKKLCKKMMGNSTNNGLDTYGLDDEC